MQQKLVRSRGLIFMWNVNVLIFYTLNIQLFAVTELNRKGFLQMYDSYNTVDTGENDLL